MMYLDLTDEEYDFIVDFDLDAVADPKVILSWASRVQDIVDEAALDEDDE